MKKWLLCLSLIAVSAKLFAQGCSLCSLQAQSIGKNAGLGLNHGIIYLASVPLIFIIVVGVIWYKRNGPKTEAKQQEQ